MTFAKIIDFPRSGRRRSPTPSRLARGIIRPYSYPDATAFGLLLSITLLVAFLYLSGAVKVEQHDILYAGVLATVWGFYFASDRLLQIPTLRPVLMRVGSFLLRTSVAGFFGCIYWLIFSRG